MSIAVVEVELGADGVWQAELADVRSADDIEHIPSLDGFDEERASVRVGEGAPQIISIFRRGDLVYARLDAIRHSTR